MRIAIFGAGGAGGYFGARLAQAGENVIFIARGNHLDAMRDKGLRIDSILGDFTISPVQVTEDTTLVGTVDVILLGVKAWQVPKVSDALKPMIGPDTMVIPLQNGVEAPAQIAQELGDQHAVGGLAKIISFRVGDGHIRHAGAEPFIAFGEMDNKPSDRTEHFKQALQKAGYLGGDP